MAQDGTTDATPALVVDVAPDGDATVTLRLAFDRTTESERQAFEALRADRENVTRRFRNRMAKVAAHAANRTGREMAVTEASVTFETVNDTRTGVVELSVTWTNLARVDGDRLVLAQPFASGFDLDRRLVVRGPEGYAFVEGSPSPTASDGRVARWAAGTSLDGYRATFAPSDETDGTGVTTPTPLPFVLLLTALTVAALGARRRVD